MLARILLLTMAAMICGTSCAPLRTQPSAIAFPHALSKNVFFEKNSYFLDKYQGESPSIEIVLSEQRAYLSLGGHLTGVSVLSTGREGYATPTGHFHITQMDEEHRSTQFGDYMDADGRAVKKDVEAGKDPVPPGAHFVGSPMPYYMRIVGGTGMHEGFLPGYPDSHGCIRMPGVMAKAFFKAVSVGTPVTIRR